MDIKRSPIASGGFSLMELMVVITIIAILSSIIIPAGTQVQRNMKKVQAQKTCTELRTALMSYFTEYKRFPALSGNTGQDAVFPTDSSTPLMRTLLGTDIQFNRRAIQFFSTKPAQRRGMPGLFASPDGSTVELLDPFLSGPSGVSNPYYVMVDLNYDNTLVVPSRNPGEQTEQIFTNVAVWSFGFDGVQGSQNTKSDDVTAY